MNDIRGKIKQSYDNTELPEELRLRVRREFLAAAEEKREGGTTMSRRIKRPAAIGLIAAAALTVTITAGAMTGAIFHRESLDVNLGEGAADEITSDVEFSSYSVENDYIRVTVDAVLCDGNSAMVYYTMERLTDPYLGFEYDGTYWYCNINCEAKYEDGTMAGRGGGSSQLLEPTEDGVNYDRCEINDIEPGRPIVLTFSDSTEFKAIWEQMDEEEMMEYIEREDYDEWREEMMHPATVQGLSLTIDTTPNYTPVTFADEEGRELYLSPYRMYTYSTFDEEELSYGLLTLVNSETGEEREIDFVGSSIFKPDENGVSYICYSFHDYITDIDHYDILEAGGTFYRQ